MGGKVTKTQFEPQDFIQFQTLVSEQLDQLKRIVRMPQFGDPHLKLGAELEIYLVDEDWQPACVNQALLQELADPQFQTELNQYNLELNLEPEDAAGTPFSKLLAQLEDKGALLKTKAEQLGVKVVPIGILPTLQEAHIQRDYMTDIPRYQVLVEQLAKLKGDAFTLNINGDEPVSLKCPDVTSEGANTSFQVHMMVKHEKFADTFNAAQLTLPLTIAISANSPILIGRKAWDETRVALFKQSLDVRQKELFEWQQPARVAFGNGWVRKDSWELFADTVANYAPLIPDCTDDDNQADELPPLKALGLHMGTIWPWNRPVYCNHGKGHVRIEFRALPAGPTYQDMLANSAFAIGLAVGLTDQIEDYISSIPFDFAEYNFYRAAQKGLDAKILWPINNHQPQEVPISQVIEHMLPVAKQGLAQIAISQEEIEHFVGIIQRRLQTGITGARWQKQTLTQLDNMMDRETACQQLVALYYQHIQSGKPVAEWPIGQ